VTETKLEQAATLIRKSPASYEHFFNNLDDPAWLKSLAEMGFFRSPPGPERSEEWVRYPGWAESRYLARVAARAPDEVLKLALAIRPTDNLRVHQNILEIAAQLPGPMATQLARKEAKWLRDYTAHLVGIPSAATALLTHLAREGQAKAAFDLAGALLALVPAEGRASGRDAVVARMSEYEYAEVINGAWPALTEADPRRALGFLCDRLGDVIRASDEQLGGADLTNFWRRAVEQHAQNVGNSFLDILVDAVRDTAVAVAQTPDGWRIATEVLDAMPEPMFQRIRLHLLRVQGSPDDVAAALSNHELAYDLNYWHEYGELLRARFAELSSEQQETVLGTIARGPELQMTPWREQQGFTPESLDESGRRSLNERYMLVADHLTGEHRAAYDALREQFGERDHPTFLSYTTSWTGPTSPYSEAELAELDPHEVVERLREWAPEPDAQAPSPEGLGRTLQKAVAARPAEYAAVAGEFATLDPTYVRALLAGLTDALRADQPLDWPPVLELCGWVLEQTVTADERDERGGRMDRDPHWGWARKQVASLLSQAFAKGPAEAPQSERNAIWALLAALAEDPDPTPAQETRGDGEGMDPATLAINTTRGEAMHGVVRYVLWVERALGEEGQATGFGFAPEAKEVLERHVDVAVDPSLAIRAVYGQWFPQFVRLDTDWARQFAPLVFPTSPELAAHFDAAWSAYVVYNRPYTTVFEVLGDAYAHAIARATEREDSPVRTDSPEERLADHLLTYRVLGATDGGGDDLFATFWKTAGSALRKQVVTQAGWSLERSPNLGAEIGSRFVATWEWIFAETSGDDPGALAGFGAWLGAPTLDGDWLLTQARAVLDLGVHLDPAFVVYRALPRLAAEHPSDTIAVLRGMMLTDTEGWSPYGATDEIREALRLVLASDDADARRAAEEVVDLLGARGMTDEFRDLVSGAATQGEPPAAPPSPPSSVEPGDS
jgi:hypothetical protein